MTALAVIAGCAAYTGLLVWLIARLAAHRAHRAHRALRAPPPESAGTLPGISVIIPFRNEAHHLGRLLASLASQRYAGAWEVILVNDGSSDDYRKSTEPFVGTFPAPLYILDSVYDPAVRLTSKQQALDAGTARSRHEWFLFTDADMRFSEDWLALWARNAACGGDMAFGHTAMVKETGGIFPFVQRFQLEFLFTTAYAFHVAGIGGSCMGNNLLVRKSAYNGIGGQAGVGYSIVEDRDLYAAFGRRRMQVFPAEPFSAQAFTYPCETMGRFYHQALRWARGGFTFRSPLLWCGLLFTFQNAAFVATLAGFVSGIAAMLAFFNFLLTIVYVHVGFRKASSGENALLFPVYFMVMLLETVVFLLSLPFTRR
ncbi:MAG TPA: glycosyltransferase, partial [Chitinivibrionales bacterium]|nr:glycosyltransferase [Chitinivibrionales bacterium]